MKIIFEIFLSSKKESVKSTIRGSFTFFNFFFRTPKLRNKKIRNTQNFELKISQTSNTKEIRENIVKKFSQKYFCEKKIFCQKKFDNKDFRKKNFSKKKIRKKCYKQFWKFFYI